MVIALGAGAGGVDIVVGTRRCRDLRQYRTADKAQGMPKESLVSM
jgi:hypothetical protein